MKSLAVMMAALLFGLAAAVAAEPSHAETRKQFAAALATAPTGPEKAAALLGIGSTFADEKNHSSARTEFEKALAIGDTTPDNKLYPEYGDDLKFSSLRETEGTLRRVLRENRSVRDFAAPDWLLANGRLARHYGLPEVKGAELQQVSIPAGSPYGGLWTQPAILKVTADGSWHLPPKFGKLVVE